MRVPPAESSLGADSPPCSSSLPTTTQAAPEHMAPAALEPKPLLFKQFDFSCGSREQRWAQLLLKTSVWPPLADQSHVSWSLCGSRQAFTWSKTLCQRWFQSLGYFPVCWVLHPSIPLHLAHNGGWTRANPSRSASPQGRPQSLCKGLGWLISTSCLLTSRGWMGPARLSPRTAV